MLGAAARAAVPYLEQRWRRMRCSIAPLAANARQSIERAIADFRKNADGVNVEAAVTGLRLVGLSSTPRRYA